jgi:hypothetical protein
MATPDEKHRRKEILAKLRAENDRVKLSELPMAKSQLKPFFDYLDQNLTEHGCDHTLLFTGRFAEDWNIPFEALKLWASNYGGYCDCEVLANVEDHFEHF